MIVLKRGKFIYGARIFSAGAVLPDNQDSRKLIADGYAEMIDDTHKKAAKGKKSEPAPSEIVPENAKINP